MKPETVLFASGNKGKLKEVRKIAEQYPEITILSPQEFTKIEMIGDPPEVEESGRTYQDNAALKASAYFSWSRIASLADDSGLEVTALDGEPGLRSARYAGAGEGFENNIEKLLFKLSGVEDRRACFRAVLFCKLTEHRFLQSEGELVGEIALSPSGEGGFGYDPIFIPQGYDETLAVLKARGDLIETHRVKALHQFFEQIRT